MRNAPRQTKQGRIEDRLRQLFAAPAMRRTDGGGGCCYFGRHRLQLVGGEIELLGSGRRYPQPPPVARGSTGGPLATQPPVGRRHRRMTRALYRVRGAHQVLRAATARRQSRRLHIPRPRFSLVRPHAWENVEMTP